MSKLTSKYALLTILSLSACQGSFPARVPGQTEPMLAGKDDLSAVGLTLGDFPVKGSYQLSLLCAKSADYDCLYPLLEAKAFKAFKVYYQKALKDNKLTTIQIFQFSFKALMEKNQDLLDFMLQHNAKIDKAMLSKVEDAGLFYLSGYPANYKSGGLSPEELMLPVFSTQVFAFKRISLAEFKQFMGLMAADARLGFLEDMVYLAAASGNLDVLKFIEAEGVSLGLEKNSSYAKPAFLLPPLFHAIRHWQQDIVAYLVQKGQRLQERHLYPENYVGSRYRESAFLFKQMDQRPSDLDLSNFVKFLLSTPVLEGDKSFETYKTELLTLVAGYPNHVPDLNAMEWLLSQGAKTYYPDTSINSYTYLPLPLRTLVDNTRPLEAKKSAISLLLRHEPEIQMNAPDNRRVNWEPVPALGDFVSEQLITLPEIRADFDSRRTAQAFALAVGNILSGNKECDKRLALVLESGKKFSADSDILISAISNKSCSDETIFRLEALGASKSPSSNTTALLAAVRRPNLFQRYLTDPEMLKNPKHTFNKLAYWTILQIDKNQVLSTLDQIEQSYGQRVGEPEDGLFGALCGKFSGRGSQSDNNIYMQVLNKVLPYQSQLDSKDQHGRTPLMYAVSSGYLPLIRFFVEKKADVNALTSLTSSNDTIKSVMDIAVRASLREVIDYLFEQSPDFSPPHHHKILDYPVERGNDEFVKYLYEKVPASQRKFVFHDEILLLYSTSSGAESPKRLLNFLLQQDLNLEVKNEKGETPLWIAGRNGLKRHYQALLEAGANPEARNHQGMSAREAYELSQKPVVYPGSAASAYPQQKVIVLH